MNVLYELEALDDNKDVLAEFKQTGIFQFEKMVDVEDCLIIVMDVEHFASDEGYEQQKKLSDTLARKLKKQVILLNLPYSDRVKFLRVKKVIPYVKGKELYSRRLRVRRKLEKRIGRQEDVEESTKEEEVQEEEATPRIEERTTWWEGAF